MIRTKERSVLCLYNKFHADRSIRSKVIVVTKFRNWVTWPRPRPYGVVLCSLRWMGPSSISVPNLKRIARFVQKLWKGSQNLEIRSRESGYAHLGVVLWAVRREVPSSMSLPNLKRITLFVEKLLIRRSQNFEIASRDPKPRPFWTRNVGFV